MAAAQPVCKFNQYGHCKFGTECRNFHNKITCQNFPCTAEGCMSRHPSQCKFFSLFGRCKFREACSYLHFKSKNIFENNLHGEIETWKEEIKVLKSAVESLKLRNSEVSQLDGNCVTADLVANANLVNSDEIDYPCDLCDVRFKSEDSLQNHKNCLHQPKQA